MEGTGETSYRQTNILDSLGATRVDQDTIHNTELDTTSDTTSDPPMVVVHGDSIAPLTSVVTVDGEQWGYSKEGSHVVGGKYRKDGTFDSEAHGRRLAAISKVAKKIKAQERESKAAKDKEDKAAEDEANKYEQIVAREIAADALRLSEGKLEKSRQAHTDDLNRALELSGRNRETADSGRGGGDDGGSFGRMFRKIFGERLWGWFTLIVGSLGALSGFLYWLVDKASYVAKKVPSIVSGVYDGVKAAGGIAMLPVKIVQWIAKVFGWWVILIAAISGVAYKFYKW